MEYLKKFESFSTGICDRCGERTDGVTTMSIFNTDIICMKCEGEERKDPDYKAAKAAEEAEIKKGNYNYGGVFPDYKPIKESEHIEFLTDRDMELDIKDICLELIDTNKITFEILKIRNTKMKCIGIISTQQGEFWNFYKDTALRLKDYLGDRYSSFWYEKRTPFGNRDKKNEHLSESLEISGNILGIYIKYRPRKFTSLV